VLFVGDGTEKQKLISGYTGIVRGIVIYLFLRLAARYTLHKSGKSKSPFFFAESEDTPAGQIPQVIVQIDDREVVLKLCAAGTQQRFLFIFRFDSFRGAACARRCAAHAFTRGADRGTENYLRIISGHPELVCICFDVTNNIQFNEISQAWQPELSGSTRAHAHTRTRTRTRTQ
jgi:hypothetical protein